MEELAMNTKMVDILLHIGETTTHKDREALRDRMLAQQGVMAADYHDDKPHLMVIEYDPDVIDSVKFVDVAKQAGVHVSLVGL
jgi:hypothetical protein